MEEVVVPALSSSSVFNSKQWQLQQHDLLLIQQRQQLEQLKKEQEELKSRLRRYGKATSTQSAQQSTKHIPVSQPTPQQPVAILTKPVCGNVSTKRNETKLPDKVVDVINDENHRKVLSEVDVLKTNLTDKSDNTSSSKDASENGDHTNAESTSSVGAAEDGQGASASVSQTTIPSSYDDERPIKPLQG